jgi:hypothetical protein
MEGGSSQLPAASSSHSPVEWEEEKGVSSFSRSFDWEANAIPGTATAALRGEPDALSWLTMAPGEFFFETDSARIG